VTKSKWLALLSALLLAVSVAACGDDDDGGGGGGDLSGNITIDGSSTVQPFAEAAAELFGEENSGVRVNVGASGTGGGFEKFCAGETDISDASRPIEDDEKKACEEKGIEYAEVQVANDGIAVVTNKGLEVDCLTTDQLKELWNKGSNVKSLSEIDPQHPDTQLSLYGPGTDSGTFDFFTEEINGEEGASREDYEASEDDNTLVTGVSGDEGGLGYFGFSYFEQNQDKLNAVGLDAGGGCVKPSVETIQNGTYKPLSRPLFMYVGSEALRRPEVKAFIEFAVDSHQEISEASQIVPMTEDQAGKAKQAIGTAEQP
jgi:phosphate transport system substrate-binding protein